ncbi:uncharacterized protein B0J16DRAFT_400736 [Fusarium flagelliforme]|uniref:uncharacterized protein n=1 Tax=Fusarium flagelliforme TaxID=2675880 RepID=UPI001E8DD5DA|nr:uncharacterized protein B0J16DRAFT_400736 [Fusarium flagelliforme]KAH7182551.1 hypothetical protein B0J16DRAFT_400736 [Fusarium flagelliforme]
MAEIIGVAASATQLGMTTALLSLIDNNCITSLLKKGRFLRTWGLFYREQDLLDIFATLERQKSTLSLAIEEIQSKTLYQIQTDIRNMAEKKAVGDSTVLCHDETEPKMPYQSERLQNTSVTDWTSSTGTQCIPRTTDVGPLNDIVSHLAPHLALSISNMGSSANANRTADTGSSDKGGGTWTGCKAGPGFNQEDGCRYIMDGKLSQELAKNSSIRCTFENSVKSGKGDQRNGHHFTFFGDTTGATIPNTNGDRWLNPQIKASESQEPQTEILGTQHNGHVIKHIDAPDQDVKRE